MRRTTIHLLFFPFFFLGLGGCQPTTPNQQEPAQGTQEALPADVWAQLRAGHQRFLTGQGVHPHQAITDILRNAEGQHPHAVVISCSDSRVPPEVVFDQGLGDLFVIRTAGHLLGDLELGSIEYAVEHLGVRTLVVLGHTECGAVTAFVHGEDAPGHIRDLVEVLRAESEEQAVLRDFGPDLARCIEANVFHTVHQLAADSSLQGHYLSGQLRVVPALYDVHTGQVRELTEVAQVVN